MRICLYIGVASHSRMHVFPLGGRYGHHSNVRAVILLASDFLMTRFVVSSFVDYSQVCSRLWGILNGYSPGPILPVASEFKVLAVVAVSTVLLLTENLDSNTP